MTFFEAIKYFRSAYQMCQKLGVPSPSTAAWKRNYGWIPLVRQLQINDVLGMALPVDRTKLDLIKRLAKEREGNEGLAKE